MTVEDLRAIRMARDLAASGAARLAREGAGLSLGETARALGVSPSTVMRWESGEVRPRGARAVRYAELLRELMQGPGANGAD